MRHFIILIILVFPLTSIANYTEIVFLETVKMDMEHGIAQLQ